MEVSVDVEWLFVHGTTPAHPRVEPSFRSMLLVCVCFFVGVLVYQRSARQGDLVGHVTLRWLVAMAPRRDPHDGSRAMNEPVDLVVSRVSFMARTKRRPSRMRLAFRRSSTPSSAFERFRMPTGRERIADRSRYFLGGQSLDELSLGAGRQLSRAEGMFDRFSNIDPSSVG